MMYFIILEGSILHGVYAERKLNKTQTSYLKPEHSAEGVMLAFPL